MVPAIDSKAIIQPHAISFQHRRCLSRLFLYRFVFVPLGLLAQVTNGSDEYVCADQKIFRHVSNRTDRTDDELDSPRPNPVIESCADDVLPCIDGNGASAAGHVAGEAVEVGVEVLSLRRPWTPDDELDPQSQGPAEVVCAI